MLLVDIMVVQVALPTIQHRLGASFTDLQWMIDAYALTLSTLILTWGSTADRFGRKRVFVTGLAIFTFASVLCGLATTSTFLIWARALQGVGGAAMFATGLALIGQEFQGPDRGKAIAAWGATVGGAVAVGPLLGGGLTSGLGWRWIFFVNIPVGLLTGWLSATKMVNKSDSGTKKLDVPGLGTFSLAMFLLIFGLLRVDADGWGSSPVLGLLCGAALMIAVFIAVERYQERPMFDLSLFRRPSFTGVSIATFAVGAGMFAMYPYITLYLQNDLGYSPLAAGLRLMPSTIPCFLVPLVFRTLAEKVAPRVALGGGLAFTAIGIGTMITVKTSSQWEVLIPGLILTGIGIGLVNPAIARIALGVVSPERSGMASGISNTFRIGGLATGVAALGAVFQRQVANSLSTKVGPSASRLAKAVSSAGVRTATAGKPGLATASHIAFVSGMRLILVIGTVLVGAGAIVGAVLVRASDFQHRIVTPVNADTETASMAAFE